jgi:magnesium chelatase family protein
VLRYQGKLSGPLLDRIDLQVEVPAAPPAEMMALPDGEASAVVAQRVAAARSRQMQRQGEANALPVPEAHRRVLPPRPSPPRASCAAQPSAWTGAAAACIAA